MTPASASVDVRTCARTLDIFEIFAELGRPVTLSEMAARLEIPVSSCYGIVRTLQSRGYLFSHSQRGPLYPTKRFLEISQKIAAGDPLLTRAAPVLADLRDETGETVVVGNLRGDVAFYLDVFVADRAIRYVPKVGETRELHATAMGKTLLGALPPTQRSATIGKLTLSKFTSATLTSVSALEKDIKAGLARGWHASIRERFDDLAAIGASVRIRNQTYGITLAGPSNRFEGAALDHLVKKLRKAADFITD